MDKGYCTQCGNLQRYCMCYDEDNPDGYEPDNEPVPVAEDRQEVSDDN